MFECALKIHNGNIHFCSSFPSSCGFHSDWNVPSRKKNRQVSRPPASILCLLSIPVFGRRIGTNQIRALRRGHIWAAALSVRTRGCLHAGCLRGPEHNNKPLLIFTPLCVAGFPGIPRCIGVLVRLLRNERLLKKGDFLLLLVNTGTMQSACSSIF